MKVQSSEENLKAFRSTKKIWHMQITIDTSMESVNNLYTWNRNINNTNGLISSRKQLLPAYKIQQSSCLHRTTKAILSMEHAWNQSPRSVWDSPSKTNTTPPCATETRAEITWCMTPGYLHSLANEMSLGEVVELITKHCTCPLFGINIDLKTTATAKPWVE